MRCLTIGFGDGYIESLPQYGAYQLLNEWLNPTAHFSDMFVLRTVLIYICCLIQNCNNVAKSWIQYTLDKEIRLCCVHRDTNSIIVKSPRKIKIYIQNFMSGLYFRQK